MKILHIAYFGKSGKLNGIYAAVNGLANSQRVIGNDVKIAITTKHSVVDNEFIFYTPTTNEFKQLLNSYNPEIVVFNSLYEIQQITFSHILRKRNIPYILVFHGGASKDNAKKGWLKKKIANWLLFDWFIHKAKAVIYLSENEYEKSIFKRINRNFHILSNGVNVPPEGIDHAVSDKMNIAFVSRMDFYGKGIDVLLEAIKILKHEGWENRIEFNFYGNNNDDTYKALLEYGDFVKYHGFVAGEQKAEAFQKASINILPSRSEGMPMTILEALSYGCPCMVTPMTNMAELISQNHCGWVIDLNAESIVYAIKKAYEDWKINPKMYYNNCRSTAVMYSWHNIAKKSIKLYQQILS